MHQTLWIRRLAPPLRKDVRLDESNMALEGTYRVGHSCRRISLVLCESDLVSAEGRASVIRCQILGKELRWDGPVTTMECPYLMLRPDCRVFWTVGNVLFFSYGLHRGRDP